MHFRGTWGVLSKVIELKTWGTLLSHTGRDGNRGGWSPGSGPPLLCNRCSGGSRSSIQTHPLTKTSAPPPRLTGSLPEAVSYTFWDVCSKHGVEQSGIIEVATDQENQGRIYSCACINIKHVVSVKLMLGTGDKPKSHGNGMVWKELGPEMPRGRKGLGALWGWGCGDHRGGSSVLLSGVMAVGAIPELHTHLTFPAFHTCRVNHLANENPGRRGKI